MSAQLEEKIQQSFYYLDYLRLHRLGRKLKLFNKNRQMMNPEFAQDPKKGYKAYIYRMYQTFLQSDFSYLDFFKPRNEFGYNFGPKDDLFGYNARYSKTIPLFDSYQEMFIYLARRWFLYKENHELFNEYYEYINNSPFLLPKIKGLFYNLRLSKARPESYSAIKNLYQLKEIHSRILNSYNKEEIIKNSLSKILNKATKISVGEKGFAFRNGMPMTVEPVGIRFVRPLLNQGGYPENVLLDCDDGTSQNISYFEVTSRNGDILKQIESNLEIVNEFKEYLLSQARTSRNLDSYQLFALSKNFYLATNCEEKRKVIEHLSYEEIEPWLKEKIDSGEINPLVNHSELMTSFEDDIEDETEFEEESEYLE